jgi:parallel beta-helix repeat protein
MRKIKFISVAIFLALILTLAGFPLAVSAATPNNTGLTAKIVAHSFQMITGHVNAAGYDIGVYIGPGVRNVTVTGATISGAHDEGILVQDTSGIVIKNSTISKNGLTGSHADPSSGNLTEDKAIVLAGTTNCLVKNNVVEDNGHGGIAVLDDGPNHPFALNAVTATLIPGTRNFITGNDIVDNQGDCGIVVSAKNPRAGVSHHGDSYGFPGTNPGDGVNDNTISNNRVVGGVGGIIVAGGALGPVNVMNNVIQDNVVAGGFIPGISIHAFGPGVITGTKLIGNVLSNNGAGEQSDNTTGIEIFAVPGVGVIKGTQVQSDTVINDYFGVWHVGDSGTTISGLLPYMVTVP